MNAPVAAMIDSGASAATVQTADALGTRLLLIDGLRGVAALSVVFFHIYENMREEVAAWIPGALHWSLSQGYLGVAIFFVLSGYVISLNVGQSQITGSFAGRFALRRAVRLDPPYWASILLAVALTFVAIRMFPALDKHYPSLAQLAAHMFYLQNLLGYGDIVAIYWTLCFEVQFYLFLLLLLFCGQQLVRGEPARVLAHRGFLLAALLAGLVSIAQFIDLVEWSAPGLFLPYWFSFSLGMFCVWSTRGWIHRGWFIAHWLAVVTAAVWRGGDATLIAVAMTAGALHLAAGLGKLRAWSLGSAFQYLGRISYSLYLFHGIVGWSAVSVLKRLMPGELGPGRALLVFAGGIAVSIACAQIAYWVVERPSVRLSHRIPLRRTAVGGAS